MILVIIQEGWRLAKFLQKRVLAEAAVMYTDESALFFIGLNAMLNAVEQQGVKQQGVCTRRYKAEQISDSPRPVTLNLDP